MFAGGSSEILDFMWRPGSHALLVQSLRGPSCNMLWVGKMTARLNQSVALRAPLSGHRSQIEQAVSIQGARPTIPVPSSTCGATLVHSAARSLDEECCLTCRYGAFGSGTGHKGEMPFAGLCGPLEKSPRDIRSLVQHLKTGRSEPLARSRTHRMASSTMS